MTKREKLTIYLDPDVAARLRAAAASEERTVAAYLRRLVHESTAGRKPARKERVK